MVLGNFKLINQYIIYIYFTFFFYKIDNIYMFILLNNLIVRIFITNTNNTKYS